MIATSSACRHVDFILAGYRYPFLRLGGASAASALATVSIHHAANCFRDHVEIVSDLIPLASDDRRHFPPPRILTKSYTMADAERCADPASPAAIVAARFAASMMSDIERAKAQLSSYPGGRLDYLVQRRLIGSMLLSIDGDTVLDCAISLSVEEALGEAGIALLVPVPSGMAGGELISEIDAFWRDVESLPWTRNGYASLVASALLTAAMKLGVDIDDLAERVGSGRTRTCRMMSRWHEMPAGPADAVPSIVALARRLSEIIVRGAATSTGSRGDVLGDTARALCPTSISAFARRFKSMAPCWSLEVPKTLGARDIVLVLGDAPAVVV